MEGIPNVSACFTIFSSSLISSVPNIFATARKYVSNPEAPVLHAMSRAISLISASSIMVNEFSIPVANSFAISSFLINRFMTLAVSMTIGYGT